MNILKVTLTIFLSFLLAINGWALAPKSQSQEDFLSVEREMVHAITNNLSVEIREWADQRNIQRELKPSEMREVFAQIPSSRHYRVTDCNDPALPPSFGEGDFIVLYPTNPNNPVIVIYSSEKMMNLGETVIKTLLPEWHYPILATAPLLLMPPLVNEKFFIQIYPSPNGLKKWESLDEDLREHLAIKHQLRSLRLNEAFLPPNFRIKLVKRYLKEATRTNAATFAEFARPLFNARKRGQNVVIPKKKRLEYQIALLKEIKEFPFPLDWLLHELFHTGSLIYFLENPEGEKKFRALLKEEPVKKIIRIYQRLAGDTDKLLAQIEGKQYTSLVTLTELFAILSAIYLFHMHQRYFFDREMPTAGFLPGPIREVPQGVIDFFEKEVRLLNPNQRWIPHIQAELQFDIWTGEETEYSL